MNLETVTALSFIAQGLLCTIDLQPVTRETEALRDKVLTVIWALDDLAVAFKREL